MDLKITSIHDHGDDKKEYVFLHVLADCNIGEYLMADSTFGADGTPSNKVRHVFFFPKKTVKKGEYISLWTQPGKDTTVTDADGDTIHRFYWGLKESVWNDDGDCAYLLKSPYSQRSQFRAGKAKKTA